MVHSACKDSIYNCITKLEILNGLHERPKHSLEVADLLIRKDDKMLCWSVWLTSSQIVLPFILVSCIHFSFFTKPQAKPKRQMHVQQKEKYIRKHAIRLAL